MRGVESSQGNHEWERWAGRKSFEEQDSRRLAASGCPHRQCEYSQRTQATHFFVRYFQSEYAPAVGFDANAKSQHSRSPHHAHETNVRPPVIPCPTCLAMAAFSLLSPFASLAQTSSPASAAPVYAVLSLIGDRLDIVVRQPQIGSRVDQKPARHRACHRSTL